MERRRFSRHAYNPVYNIKIDLGISPIPSFRLGVGRSTTMFIINITTKKGPGNEYPERQLRDGENAPKGRKRDLPKTIVVERSFRMVHLDLDEIDWMHFWNGEKILFYRVNYYRKTYSLLYHYNYNWPWLKLFFVK